MTGISSVTRRFGKRIEAGYPQVLLLRLVEVGTHLAVETLIKPCSCGEYPLAPFLLHKAPPDALVLWDRGFYGHSLLKQAMEEGKHVLARVASHVVFDQQRRLADGSFLARIYPSWKDRRRGTGAIVVRVIEYTLDDEHRPGHGQPHRLVTTLLDERAYPAR